MATVPRFFIFEKLMFVIVEPSRNCSAIFIPSIIFVLSAPMLTNEQSNISPEIPATCGSMIITINWKLFKMHINSVGGIRMFH